MKNKRIFYLFLIITFIICQVKLFAEPSSIEKELLKIKHNIDIINRTELPENKRIQALDKMLNQLEQLLLNKNSRNLNQSVLDKYSVSLNMYQDNAQNNLASKIIVYVGPSDLLGTLERTWVFAQSWKNNTPSVYRVAEESNEVPVGLKVIDNRWYIVGYLIHTRPNPVYIQSFVFNKQTCKKELIKYSNKKINKKLWNIFIEDNNLVVEIFNKDELKIKLKDNNEVYICETDNEKNFIVFDLVTSSFNK